MEIITMHSESYNQMQRCVSTYLDEQRPATIVDVGSMDVNGSYRSIFDRPQWHYIGLDIAAGNNVDIVLKDPYRFPLKSNSYDVVISGQAFEHIEFFWMTWLEMVRILRPGGLAILALPQNIAEHRYPVDCWRFFPDSMTALAKYGGLLLVEAGSYQCRIASNPEWVFLDTIGVFRKPSMSLRSMVKQLLITLGNRMLSLKS